MEEAFRPIFLARATDLTDNRADDNGTYGFYLRGELQTLTEADLIAGGNTATGNGIQDFLLQPS